MEILLQIIAPVITGIVTLIGVVLANRKSQAVRDTKAEMKEEELSAWRKRIEDKLDEHNEYGKKWADTNALLARLDERIKNLEAR